MKIAIVANGDSLLRLKKGVEIDSHDIVIRLNLYYALIDPETTGVKISIWSCAFGDLIYDDENRSEEIWCARPRKWENNNKWTIGNKVDHGRITRDISEGEYGRIASIVLNAGGTNPTTGFLTLKFVQKIHPKAEIDLYGYDFFDPPKHYYEDHNIVGTGHNKEHSPKVEKKLIMEGVKKGEYRWIY